jgi:hypothetical protein
MAAPQGAALIVFRCPEGLPLSNQSTFPLMPHATASWLVDNTALTFEQIAEFWDCIFSKCRPWPMILPAPSILAAILYILENRPRARSSAAQANPDYRLRMQKAPISVSRTKGPRYTPVSKRQDKPDGIAWILRHHPKSRMRRSAS